DIGLPDAHGLDAVEILLAEQPNLPVVVLTGWNDDRLGRLAIQRGAQEFIRKRDLSASVLRRTMSQAFERIRQRDMERHLAQSAGWTALGQLSAGVAHEINNPASTVLLNIEDLRDALLSRLGRGSGDAPPLDTEGMLRLAEDSLDATKRITSLVASLGSFSAIAHRDVARIDLAEALRTAVGAVEKEIRVRAELVMDLQPVPPVVADRARIIQVFVNLLINACHALDRVERSEHRITVTLRNVTDHLSMSVSDTGPGIPAGVVSKIFDPFFTTKGRRGGTGLGLSVSRTTIEQHRGNIRVMTDPSGTRFEVSIPLDTGLEPEDEVERSAPPAPAAQPQRILVIEDEETLRQAIVRRLSKRYDVDSASTVDEGLIRIERASGGFDLILCDLMMPDKDGKDFFEALERRCPHDLERVVFMTGGAYTSRISDFMGAVTRPVLRKPFGLNDIQAVLASKQGAAWRRSRS
ncbi:MAG: ATP-binding protein, partial [Myxococcota bacterium]